MDVYEVAILWTSAAIATALGWFSSPCVGLFWAAWLWHTWRWVCTTATSPTLVNRHKANFVALFVEQPIGDYVAIGFNDFAFVLYALGAIVAWKQERRLPENGVSPQPNLLLGMASGLAWSAAFAGFVGLLVRWHESYLLRPDAGISLYPICMKCLFCLW